MEDKISNTSLSAIRDFLINQSLKNTMSEICGFVGYDNEKKHYVATIEKNQASDPKFYFTINPVNYLKFKNSYSLIGIFHSHVVGDESASEFDIKMSEACCISFIIYSINSNKFNIYEPKNKDYDVNKLERIRKKLK